MYLQFYMHQRTRTPQNRNVKPLSFTLKRFYSVFVQTGSRVFVSLYLVVATFLHRKITTRQELSVFDLRTSLEENAS